MASLKELEEQKLLAEIEKIKQEAEQIKASYLDQDNKKLESEKLQAEIAKLKEEANQIKKPWYFQTSFLNVFVTILVPILTITIAYFFGGGKDYFDTQKLKLSIESGKLQDSVKKFENKRDMLNQKNIKLVALNKELESYRHNLDLDRKALASDTATLNKKVAAISLEISNISKEKDNLNKDNASLQNKNRDIALKNRKLSEKSKALIEDLKSSPFTVTWEKFKSADDYMYNLHFNDLRDLIAEDSTQQHPRYINTIKKFTDTSKEIAITGECYLLLYLVTRDDGWKNKFYNTGDKICGFILKKPDTNYSRYFRYWRDYRRFREYFFVRNSQEKSVSFKTPERMANAKRLLAFAKKIPRHFTEMEEIFQAIDDCVNPYPGYDSNDQPIIDYLREPTVFCYLLENIREMETIHMSQYYGQGRYSLMYTIAPIGFICLMANEITNDSKNNPQLQIDQFLSSNALKVFTNNPSLPAISNTTSVKAWKQWKNENQSLINDFLRYPNHVQKRLSQSLLGTNKVVIISLLGTRSICAPARPLILAPGQGEGALHSRALWVDTDNN